MPEKRSNYSTKPNAVRARLKKANKTINEDVALVYKKPIEELDFEELQYGKPRREDGTIARRGPRPKWITPAVIVEAQRRLKTVTGVELAAYSGNAIAVMVDLMNASNVDIVRFNAAKYVLDQIMGMPTQRVEQATTINVQSFLADVMVNPDGQKAIEGEYTVTYDDDTEDDDGE